MNKNWFAVITAEVLYDKRLNPRQKLLVAAIANMSNEKGYCFATNNHFSEMFDCSVRSIQRDIETLLDLGFINRVLKLKDNGEVELRVLTPMTPVSPPHDIHDTTPHDTSVTYNNKYINNKDNKLNYIPQNQDFSAEECKSNNKPTLFFTDRDGNWYDSELKPIKNPLEKEKSSAKKEKEHKRMPDEVYQCYEDCKVFFDEHLLPNKPDEYQKWFEVIEKLNRIDGIPFNKIVEIVQWARNDSFWSKNFLSLRKLRTKDKNGVKYAVIFNEKLKDKKPLTLAEQMRKEHNL